MKIAIYIRTSTKEQEPENQLDACMQLNQWGEYEVFKDQQSAWKDNKERDDFNRLLGLIKKGQVSHLIVWDLDRLYRNRLRLVEFFKLCKAYKCTIHSVRQAWLEDITKMPQPWNDIVFDLALNIMGWIGEEESSKKSDRVKKATRKVDGQTLSYKGNKWGRKAVSNQKKAQIEAYFKTNRTASIRQAAEALGLGVGTVHKYYREIQAENDRINQASAINQFANTIEGAKRFKAAVEAVVGGVVATEGGKLDFADKGNFELNQPPLNKETEAKKDGVIETPQSGALEVQNGQSNT